MNFKIKWVHIFLCTLIFVSCEETELGNADGRVYVITQSAEVVTDLNDNFAIGYGDIKLEGKSLPNSFSIVGKGIIYGMDSSALEIKSHSYSNDRYNNYYGCFQDYSYSPVSNSTSVISIEITDTIWKDNGQVYGYEFFQAGGYGAFACPLTNLLHGTKYFVRSFAHVSNNETFNKYLYGDIKEFVSGGITKNPTVYVALEALGIGVMKEDIQIATGFTAIRYCSQVNFDKSIGGYSDWRVPTLNELKEIYKLQTQIGGFKSAWYFSSNEGPSPYYYYWNFATNTSGCEQLNGYGSQVGYIRLVRPLR
jgi:hypothetical protein